MRTGVDGGAATRTVWLEANIDTDEREPGLWAEAPKGVLALRSALFGAALLVGFSVFEEPGRFGAGERFIAVAPGAPLSYSANMLLDGSSTAEVAGRTLSLPEPWPPTSETSHSLFVSGEWFFLPTSHFSP